jgi:hypothetical protein
MRAKGLIATHYLDAAVTVFDSIQYDIPGEP